ncbi:MAG: hypothetical protein ACJ77N_02745 [Chloroflexota bacterium]
MLPSKLAGAAYEKLSFAGRVEDDVAGGDVCSYFCPGELSAYAKGIGMTSGPMTIALAFPADTTAPTGAFIRVVRLAGQGVGADALVRSWIGHADTKERRVLGQGTVRSGGKQLSWTAVGSPTDPLFLTYLYARDDTLFIINARPAPDDPNVPGPLLEETFRSLP